MSDIQRTNSGKQFVRFLDIIELPENLKPTFKDFFTKMENDDDWSVIIKLHAILESLFSSLLSQAYGEGRLKDAFSHLDMSNSKCGKAVLLRDLGLITDEHAQYVFALSQVRNAFVHDACSVTLTLADYIAKLEPTKQKELMKRLAKSLPTQTTPAVALDPWAVVLAGALKLLEQLRNSREKLVERRAANFTN